MLYQLKAIRKNAKPPIWRRIIIPGNITFTQLAVILEELLEYSKSDAYEFQFYNRKERIREQKDGSSAPRDYYYSYLSGQDTFINQRMEEEKSFSFYLTTDLSESVEYRLEIEKIFEGARSTEDGSCIDMHHPIITKQSSPKDDPFWTDPNAINDRSKRDYVPTEAVNKGVSHAEIVQAISEGKGLSFCREISGAETYLSKSVSENIREIAEMVNKHVDANSAQPASGPAEKTSVQSPASAPAQKASVQSPASAPAQKASVQSPASAPKHRDCKLEDVLKAYTKDELLLRAEEENLAYTSTNKRRLAYELARHLLEPATMRRNLLQVDDHALDAFEQLIDLGHVKKSDEMWELLSPISAMDYIAEFTDDSIQVPDEVILVYQTICRSGYRKYHTSAHWLLQCVKAANYLYMSTPLKVLYKLYQQNTFAKETYEAFLDLLNKVTESPAESIVLNDRVVIFDFYITGAYKILEKSRKPVEFYIPRKEEILFLARHGYPNGEKSYQDLYLFFVQDMNLPTHLAEYYTSAVYQVFSTGNPTSYLMKLLDEKGCVFRSEEQVKKFKDLAANASPETRMPELCGHKLNEMPLLKLASQPGKQAHSGKQAPASQPAKQTPATKATEKRIYPNAPCPCGSGKKYKKCCGRRIG